MGYEVKFKIKELDNKFKPQFKDKPCDEDEMFKQKQILLNFIMIFPERGEYLNMNKIYNDFDMYFRIYVSYLEENWKWSIQERLKKDEWTEENEIYFCGWEFSQNRGDVDLDKTKEYYFEHLFNIYSVVKTPDYFTDKEHYHDKYYDISKYIDEFTEAYYDELNKDFVNFYRDKEETEIDESY